jgi:DNA-binding NarL/FixJ family response regulator
MRALIVDDEPVARKVLREELEVEGVEVVGEAENGETALPQAVTLARNR